MGDLTRAPIVVPFAEGTILPAVKVDVDLQGELFLSLMGDPMTVTGRSSRTVFVDATKTVVVKAEHSWNGTFGAVQCWNEYVYWGEYIQGTYEAELLVPTLELDARWCPMPTHNRYGRNCVITMNIQEYVNDGLADDVFVGAPEGHDPNPWDDCMRPLLRRHPELRNDLSEDRPDQARYCMYRGRFVVVDYGLPSAFGWALTSEHYESPDEWRKERLG